MRGLMHRVRAFFAQFARYIGLALVVAGGAGMSIGYVGGKDAEARRPTAMKIEVKRQASATTAPSRQKSAGPLKTARRTGAAPTTKTKASSARPEAAVAASTTAPTVM